MSSKNQTQVIPGNVLTLDIYLRSYYGGPLTNADAIPTFAIYDSSDVLLYSGTSTHTAVGTYTATYNVSATATISDYYRIVWTAAIGGTAVPDAWEYFRVVPATPEYEAVSISNDWLIQIKKVLAYPKKENIILSDDEIKQFAVFPAMTQYFIKFPVKETIELQSSDLLTIPFPDTYTYGLVDCRVVDVGTIGGTGSSFWDIIAYQRMGVSGNMKSYGKRGFNPNALYQQRINQQYAMKSQMNLLATIKFNVDYPNRQVIVYSSTTGKVNITWAKYSTDFEDILFQRKFDVIQLAQANLLDHFADTFGIISDGSLDVNFNIESIRTRATALRTEITDKWMSFPTVIMLKNV
jgi:hypothetical protein